MNLYHKLKFNNCNKFTTPLTNTFNNFLFTKNTKSFSNIKLQVDKRIYKSGADKIKYRNTNKLNTKEYSLDCENKLFRALQKEKKHEDDNYNSLSEYDIAKFCKRSKFQIIDEPNNNLVTLIQEKDDLKVIIEFRASCPLKKMESDDQFNNSISKVVENKEMKGDDYNDEVDIFDYINFNIAITNKKKKNSGVMFECYGIGNIGKYCINDMYFNDKNIEEYKEKHGTYMTGFGEMNSENYTLIFETLSPLVRANIYSFLESEYKIDGDLISFIHFYAEDKEQRLYMNWLDNTMNFLI